MNDKSVHKYVLQYFKGVHVTLLDIMRQLMLE